ncbi:FUSC family protein [Puerhibacterium sp. TATVAM-FAB25]|uniref:FUSC family protein n=1 Tax=Puerhibacterium sp. TATVAM-FAB25 TaxID=3093699 RepID=UPI003979A265
MTPPHPVPATGPGTERPAPASRLARAVVRRLVVRSRVRQGWSRVRASFWPVLQASLAAGVAYGIGLYVLGHEMPFFAAIAAWVCLGFSFERELRKIAEVAVGVAVGVGMGDLVVHLIGAGWWQLVTVMFVSALLGRFIDRGAVLASQAGTQAIVVAGLPILSGGPFGRWADALVGGLVALAVALLTPGDPRRALRTAGATATNALADTLRMVATALREADPEGLQAALVRGRAAEPALQDWMESAHHASDQARVSVNRRHRDEIVRLEKQAVLVERAMRSVRVLARRAAATVALVDLEHLEPMADLVDRYAVAVGELAAAVSRGTDLGAARAALEAVAHDADPHVLGAGAWEVQALVMLVRSPVVDTLEATGATGQEARAALTEL